MKALTRKTAIEVDSPPLISAISDAKVLAILAEVSDPEIPVLSVLDLGIVRHAHIGAHQTAEIAITPTYSGCPATQVIKADIRSALRAAGFVNVSITEVLSPPWTTDWISEAGRQKLQEYGISPPTAAANRSSARIACPRCASTETAQLSEFGSTPCKALYRCTACLEPFDHFKCL